MKTTLINWYANAVQTITIFVKQAVQPVYYASVIEASIIASIGVILLVAGIIISRRGLKSPAYEAVWTDKLLQFTGVFGMFALLLAFLRYEGIPYGSMSLVLVIVVLWALITVVQLLRYRRLVVQVARARQSEHKARDAYLPKARKDRQATR